MGRVISFEDAYNQEVAQKKRKRKAGSIRWILVILFFLCCIAAGYYLSQLPIFNITEILVSGNADIPTEDILRSAGIQKGQHIFSVDLQHTELMVGTNYLIEQVEVRRVLPNQIAITVKERTPIVAVQIASGIVQIDASGMVLKKQQLLEGLPLMILSGINDLAEEKCQPGVVLESQKLAAGMAIVLKMGAEALSVISELEVDQEQRIVAHTTYGVDFRLGDGSQFNDKFAICMDILRDEEAHGNLSRLHYIDVAVMDKPVISYNKMQESK